MWFKKIHVFRKPRPCTFRREDSKIDEIGTCYGILFLLSALIEDEQGCCLMVNVDTIQYLDVHKEKEISEEVVQ